MPPAKRQLAIHLQVGLGTFRQASRSVRLFSCIRDVLTHMVSLLRALNTATQKPAVPETLNNVTKPKQLELKARPGRL